MTTPKGLSGTITKQTYGKSGCLTDDTPNVNRGDTWIITRSFYVRATNDVWMYLIFSASLRFQGQRM